MRNGFVVGCPRSGTSWVRNILDRHPDVTCGPESHLFPMVHGVVSAEPTSPHWPDVLGRFDEFSQRPVGPHRWVDRDTLARIIDDAVGRAQDPPSTADAIIASVIAHYRERRRLPEDRLLIEKTPTHLFFAERMLTGFPDARFVEVRRDGRDVAVSMERRATRVDWPPRERHEQIKTWVRAIDEGLRVAALPIASDRWLVVRFEDLIADRRAEIERMYRFFGLRCDDQLLDAVIAATDISQAAITGDGEHVRIGKVGDWRNHFTAEDSTLFQDLAGGVFATAGYDT